MKTKPFFPTICAQMYAELEEDIMKRQIYIKPMTLEELEITKVETDYVSAFSKAMEKQRLMRRKINQGY